jgi:hypothetical protein
MLNGPAMCLIWPKRQMMEKQDLRIQPQMIRNRFRDISS